MFTGIIEAIGTVMDVEHERENLHFQISTPFLNECKIDQSIAHNGVCLTITEIEDNGYWVTAIQETLSKTNLSKWKQGDKINLERCVKVGDRLDGHIVQGHVDAVGRVENIAEKGGSWEFEISNPTDSILISKGSITVNGVSLTIVKAEERLFSLGIIPYTYEHTVFQYLQPGEYVNLEFDIVGKYMLAYFQKYCR